MRLFGSRAVFALVSFAFIPFIREQNDERRFAAVLPAFTLPVTAVLSLLPGLAAL